ncbi:hypothetical protein [Methanosalsum zhilinae]|nr:hypothetical protein [Methanosalsum zhilinae]
MKKIYFKNYFSSDISDLYSFLQRDFAVGFDLKKFKHIFMPQVHSKKEKDPFNFDIFEYISNFTGRPISLDNIAAQTLQVGLNHKSKLPVIEWETENMKNHLDVYRNIEHGYHISAGINIYNTIDQCRHNVELVHGIYTFGVENGYISYLDKGSNTVLKMEVDW